MEAGAGLRGDGHVVAIDAYCPVEFFDNADRLLDVVTRLTNLHEQTRSERWAVTRLDGKRRMSQNRNAADRAGVIEGLSAPV